jgi:AI-2 transport protein TqsA
MASGRAGSDQSREAPLAEQSTSPSIRFLQGAAYCVVILVGLRLASPVLAPLLLALLLAYSVLPLPRWLMARFGLGTGQAMVATVALLGALQLVLVVLLELTALRMQARLPAYEEHARTLWQQGVAYLGAQGVDTASLSPAGVLDPDRLLELGRKAAPEVGSILSNGLLISLVGWLFLIEMVSEAGVPKGPLAERLFYYGGDVQRYIALTARTGAINTAANFVWLVLMGVDFPVLWCVLYFFLNFIPTLGFIMAIVPPTLLALLMLGWQKALVVACGLAATNLVVDNVITPRLMKNAVDVSFLTITVSLVFWGFLLGPAGAIVAIPLTLSLRKFIERLERDPSRLPPGKEEEPREAPQKA